jgi:O-antigen ligase
MLVSYQVSRIKGFKRWALLGLSVVLLTVLAPSRFGSASMREQDRSKLWGDGIAMFKAHILFGVGAGQFSDVQEDHKVAHNTYVNILAETGVVGYMPYFLLLYFCFVHFRRVMNLGTLVEASDRIQMAGLYSAAVGCFTAMYFLSRQTSLVSYIILGLMTAKAAGACKTPDLFQRVFVQSAKEYRKGLLWGLGSIVFMWITIRIVNATG